MLKFIENIQNCNQCITFEYSSLCTEYECNLRYLILALFFVELQALIRLICLAIASVQILDNLILQIINITRISMRLVYNRYFIQNIPCYLLQYAKETKKVEQVEIMRFVSNQCLIRLSVT